MNALATTNSLALDEMSVQAIIDRKRKLLEVMEAVMVEGTHYGKIPGCGDKPTLHKAGAEVLATVFGLAPTFVVIEANLAGGHREYRVTCTLTHIGSQFSLGEGVGICSTMESKYRWRGGGRKCPTCGKEGTIQKSKHKPEFYCWVKKDGCGATFALDDKTITEQETGRAENPDIADAYNTVLKMAKKRAQVDATLTAVGASDILTQDLEDLPQGSRPEQEEFPRGSEAPAGVQDAEFRDVPASRPAERDFERDINNAQTIAALEAMIPDLSKLKGELYGRCRRRYGERRDELLKRSAA